MWKIWVLLFLLLILGGLLGYKIFFIGRSTEIKPQVIGDDNNYLYVANQRPDTLVIVSQVALTKKGFVVIYGDIDGNRGPIIGNTKILPIGKSENVSISLIRPSIQGEALFAVLHEDSGDGVFSPPIDIPLKDEYGNIISTRFSINQSASGQ